MAVLFAAVAAVVALVFAAQLVRQFVARRRPHALAWAISLTLYAAASAAMAVGVATGWTVPVFAVYWLGPLLTVPFLAAGQLHLLDPRGAVLWWTLVGLCVVWTLAALSLATFESGVLTAAGSGAGAAIPLGREVLGDSLLYGLLRPFTYLFVVVVVGSIVSAVRTRRWQLLLIVLGVSISAAASSTAGNAGLTQWFPLLLAAGVTVMYAGFLGAGRAPAGAGSRRPVVTVYTRADCGLCRTAEATVAYVARRRADVVLVDIDAEPALADRYTLRVPVVAVDGEEIAEYQIEPQALRAAIRAAARRPDDVLEGKAAPALEEGPGDWFDGALGDDVALTYRCADLDRLLVTLRGAGVTVADTVEERRYGRVAWAVDPRGRRVELWQPAADRATRGPPAEL